MMGAMVDRAGLKVAGELAAFFEDEALPGTGITPAALWRGTASIFARFSPRNLAIYSGVF